MTKLANVFEPEFEHEHDREGYRWRGQRVGPKLGAERIGASIYDLDAGERTFPYHFHYGNEEWLIVLGGPVVLRTPEGEQDLDVGDTACFREGPVGAHKVTNRGEEIVRAC